MHDLDNVRNPLFTAADVEGKLQAFLITLMTKTCREGFSISDADIAEIAHARSMMQELVAKYGMLLENLAKERQANLKQYSVVTFISMGEDCLPRTLLTQWGLKKNSKLGEPTIPFDLSIHPLQTAIHLIESDFAGYLDVGELSYNEASRICGNKRLNVAFNHESGPDYAINNFERLITIYRRRVDTLRQILSSSSFVILVLHVRNPSNQSNELAHRLLSSVGVGWPGTKFCLICINSVSPGGPRTPSVTLDPALHFINIPYPWPGYVWHFPQHCFTPEGIAFEQVIASEIRAVTNYWSAHVPRA